MKKGLRIVRAKPKKSGRIQSVSDFIASHQERSDFKGETLLCPAFTNIQTRILERLTQDYITNIYTEGLLLEDEDKGHLATLIRREFIGHSTNGNYKLVLDISGTPMWQLPYQG